MTIASPLGTLTMLRPRSATLYISQNQTVLITLSDGAVAPDAEAGLFVKGARVLSRFRHLIDGKPPGLVALSTVEQHSSLGYYIFAPPGCDKASEQTIEVRLSRYVGEGLHEDIDLTSFARKSVSFTLGLVLDADFADMTEVQNHKAQGGSARWSFRRTDGGCELTAEHHAEHRYEHQGDKGVARYDAGVVVYVRGALEAPSYDEKAHRLDFRVELAPRSAWHCCVEVIARIGGETLPLLHGCRSFFDAGGEREEAVEASRRRETSFSATGTGTLAHTVEAAVARSQQDLAALRRFDLYHDERAWTIAAGWPTYGALFGRDALAAGAQCALLTADILAGAAAELPRWQGRKVDDWRDEEPGRMLHQAQEGPRSALKCEPLGRTYAAVTSSMFYPVAVSELWHWTGDRERVAPLIEPAVEAIRWLDRYGDLDGDGFYEYEPHSEQSLRNQGWKDSDDAIVHADGSEVRPPIGTCEMQGLAYLAKLRLSELLLWFGRPGEALRLLREARELHKRFNDRFWMPDAGSFAMGIDPQKRLIQSIASDPSLCLSTGIVDRALAEPLAERLFAEDMFSGWGVRTLSSEHPAYNPYSYHRGSVWPVVQGALALGLARYGLHERLATLGRALFEAASLFPQHRLPECFAGHPRDGDHPFPALYPKADWPQAWSASSVFAVLQAMVGIYPYAPLDLLLIDPALPEWLPTITLSNLHVGKSVLSLRFSRNPSGRTDFEVLDRRGSAHVVRQPSPWSLVAGPTDRLWDLISSARS